MAHVKKWTRTTAAAAMKESERAFGERTKNPDIDHTRTHLNYDLADQDRGGLQKWEYYKKRLGEVKCLNRKDVNTLCTWVVTLPQNVPDDLQETFFRETYKFAADRYGRENMCYATVHLDETRPHIHIGFVPVDDRGRVNAKKVVSRTDLQTFHGDLQEHLTRCMGITPELLTGATREQGGNQSIDQLKHNDRTLRYQAAQIDQKAQELRKAEEATQEAVKASQEAQEAARRTIEQAQRDAAQTARRLHKEAEEKAAEKVAKLQAEVVAKQAELVKAESDLSRLRSIEAQGRELADQPIKKTLFGKADISVEDLRALQAAAKHDVFERVAAEKAVKTMEYRAAVLDDLARDARNAFGVGPLKTKTKELQAENLKLLKENNKLNRLLDKQDRLLDAAEKIQPGIIKAATALIKTVVHSQDWGR